MITTPNGRYLGRLKDRDNGGVDHLFKMAHAASLLKAIPQRASERAKFPTAFDQIDMSACGPNCGSAVMKFFFPEKPMFSRLQLYHGVRSIEDTVDQDAGVETRDLFRVMQITGVAPERLWEYDKAILKLTPTEDVFVEAAKCRINSFSRLIAENEYLACLAEGFPIILGIEVFDSIDSDALAKTGVMPMPDPRRERVSGGHDVTVIGYDLDFKNSDIFKKSGVDPALVSDRALEIRNSWGPSWGDAGHFWMPIQYATDSTLGNDAWTARI